MIRDESFTTIRGATPIEENGAYAENFVQIKINNHHVGATVLACVFAPYLLPVIGSCATYAWGG